MRRSNLGLREQASSQVTMDRCTSPTLKPSGSEEERDDFRFWRCCRPTQRAFIPAHVTSRYVSSVRSIMVAIGKMVRARSRA